VVVGWIFVVIDIIEIASKGLYGPRKLAILAPFLVFPPGAVS
jgi:hypothetical protein